MKTNVDNPAQVVIPVSYPDTTIFNGTGPNGAYADLDTGIGRQGIVYLQVTNTDIAIGGFYFRTRGETLNTGENGICSAPINTGGNHTSYFWVITDSLGYVQWIVNVGITCIVKVKAVI